jgi:hypothetical protein
VSHIVYQQPSNLQAVGAGWGFWVDGTYLAQGSALSITASTRTKVENDGASGLTQTGYLSTLPSTIWDTTNDKFVPELGDAYICRLSFKCETAAAGSGNYFDVELDIGSGGIGTGPVVWGETTVLAKGQNTTHQFAYAVPVFALAPFPTTGGTFFVTPNVDMDVWDIRFFVSRIYNEA